MRSTASRGSEQVGTTAVDFFADPSCPWAWMTSRWLAAVAPERGLNVRWRSFSIAYRDRDRDRGELSSKIPQAYREAARARKAVSPRALRLFEAVRSECGETAVGQLYTEIGRRLFQRGRPPEAPAPDLLGVALAAAGLDVRLELNADDSRWDAVVTRSTEEALTLVGPDAETPTIVLDGEIRQGMSGPIVSPPPGGELALRVWDAFRTLLEEPTFFEVRRARRFPPLFPEL